MAKKKGIQGAVRMDAVIGKNGRVVHLQSISGNPVLVDAAKDAVMQWVYRPTLLNGEPIEVIIEVCVPLSGQSRHRHRAAHLRVAGASPVSGRYDGLAVTRSGSSLKSDFNLQLSSNSYSLGVNNRSPS